MILYYGFDTIKDKTVNLSNKDVVWENIMSIQLTKTITSHLFM